MITHKKIYSAVFFLVLLKIIVMLSQQTLVEEAYYWNYARNLDYGYLDHPPMVAILIAMSKFFFGDNELAIRLPALICWVVATVYTCKLSELIRVGTGKIAMFLMAILPFFFLQSMFMTPDLPQMMFWSATLYYCYRAIIMDEKNCFYSASIALGLGLLSKYTIVLLVPATLVLISIAPEYRKWWRGKELYLGAIIVLLLFSPVIYWNYKHNWISFAFQTTVRIQDTHRFSTHLVLLYTVFFIMPGGLWGLKKLVTIKQANNDQNFIKVYTILPLLVFTLFSFHNQIKFNWLGPVFLALVPWIAYLLQTSQYPRHCYRILMGLIPAYMVALLIMVSSEPAILYKLFFNKFFSWYNLSIDVNKIAQEIEKKNNKAPFLLAMDKYNINSEISFYQQKAVHNKTIIKSYPVLGQHVFNNPSLMFKLWDKATNHHGDCLIIMSWNKSDLRADYLTDFVKFTSDIQAFLTYSPRGHYHLSRLYFRTAEML